MKAMKIDFLAFTGHKDLMAIPGVGGLCCESSEHFEPLVQGGTGIHGEEYTNPDIFPEGYEAGTLNMPAIWSIHASINYLTEHFSEIAAREKCLMKYAAERGYGAKWQRERRKFLESNPFCVKCYEEGHITMATVVDHIVPHRGDQKLFWDRGNWQPLCEHHHNVKTMTEDRYVEYKF